MELSKVLEANGACGFTFYEIKGRGRMKVEPVQTNRGVSHQVPEFSFRVKIEAVVCQSVVADIVRQAAATLEDSGSDGKIFIYDLEEASDLGFINESEVLRKKKL